MTTKKSPLQVTFLDCLCDIVFGKYGNGRTAIELIGAEGSEWEGEPVAIASVNIWQAPLKDNEILIKNWSENEGILEVLQRAKIIGPVITTVPTGFVYAHQCELLVNPEDYK